MVLVLRHLEMSLHFSPYVVACTNTNFGISKLARCITLVAPLFIPWRVVANIFPVWQMLQASR